MKILVTGCADFIGPAVNRHIIHSTGDSVVNLEKLPCASNLKSLVKVSYRERYIFRLSKIEHGRYLKELLA